MTAPWLPMPASLWPSIAEALTALWWLGLGSLLGASALLPWRDMVTPHVCTKDCRLFCAYEALVYEMGPAFEDCYHIKVKCLAAHSKSGHVIKAKSVELACKWARWRHIERGRAAIPRIFPR